MTAKEKHAAAVQRWRKRRDAARYQRDKEVMKLKARERYAKNPQRYIAEAKAYAKRNRDKVRLWTAKRRRKRKIEVLQKYGGVCVCCGESEPVFLTIDHVHDNGKEHRKVLNGNKFYLWLLKNPVDPDYQVLCMNCNWGKSQNKGVCPHKQKGKS